MMQKLEMEQKELSRLLSIADKELHIIRCNFHDIATFPDTYARYINSFRWKSECLEAAKAIFSPNILKNHNGKHL